MWVIAFGYVTLVSLLLLNMLIAMMAKVRSSAFHALPRPSTADRHADCDDGQDLRQRGGGEGDELPIPQGADGHLRRAAAQRAAALEVALHKLSGDAAGEASIDNPLHKLSNKKLSDPARSGSGGTQSEAHVPSPANGTTRVEDAEPPAIEECVSSGKEAEDAAPSSGGTRGLFDQRRHGRLAAVCS